MKPQLRALSIFLSISSLIAPLWVFADERADKAKELEKLREKIKSVQSSLGGLANQKNSLMGQLSEIELKYGQLIQSLRGLENKAQTQSQQMADLRLKQHRMRDDILRQNKALIGQTRQAYVAGRQEWFKLILSQDDPTRVNRILTYYGYLNKARFYQLNLIQKDLTKAKTVEAELQTESQKLDTTRDQIIEQQKSLEQAKLERRQLLVKLERETQDKSAQLVQLQEDADRLQGLIGSIAEVSNELPTVNSGRPFSSLRGQLGWPVKGALLENFGNPRLSTRWDGMLIGAQEGAAVRAIFPGRVAFSDWLRGYGLLMIIDHGEGYMSLYAFNQSLYKNVGDTVDVGEVIASVGASGGQAEAGLYFGIREKGRPINPLFWLVRGN